MEVTRRELLKSGGLMALMVGLTPASGSPMARPVIRWKAKPADISDDPALHLLRRASFGPTRAELERARSMGVEAWIEEQLYPDDIDDSELENRLAALYPTINMSLPELRQLDEPGQVMREIAAATMARAIYSKRQLLQVLVDHWNNHFSVYMPDGGCRFSKSWEDREVMRRYALATFRELVGADAHSPCMLEYLDNFTSRVGAPNENYARELMELHTLGVDGGYTETDVKEVARAFTGWTIARRTGGQFIFRRRWHDDGEKEVLGHILPAGRGEEDGEQVLDILAAHESTAHYVSLRLCRRFVSDNPSEEIVNHAAKVFRDANGDLRSVVRAILLHDDFWAAAGQKIRRPFEYIAAAARTLEIPDLDGHSFAFALHLMGQGFALWPAPNGYPDVAGAWINTDTLLKRWNFCLMLAEGRIRDAVIPWDKFENEVQSFSADAIVDFFISLILHQTILPEDRAALIDFLHGDDGPFDVTKRAHRRRVLTLVGLILDSPYFQWR